MLYKKRIAFPSVSENHRQEERRYRGKAHKSTKNQELIELLELEKDLVYFHLLTVQRSRTGKADENREIKKYPEDTDLLEDVIIENKQAIEMANIYRNFEAAPWMHLPPLFPIT